MTRIGEARLRRGAYGAGPDRDHAELVGEIADRDLGAELVDVELVGERLRQRAGNVEQEALAAVGRRHLGDQEIDDDLALRRQQRAESGLARMQLADVGGEEPVEELACIVAADLDHAPVVEKRRFHSKNLLRQAALKRKPPWHKPQG